MILFRSRVNLVTWLTRQSVRARVRWCTNEFNPTVPGTVSCLWGDDGFLRTVTIADYSALTDM
jgi:hypothetical protein